MNETNFLKLENLFLALADKTRLRLLALMSGGEVPVGFLANQLGESQPKISRHLAYLRTTGLVSTRRDGKHIYYGIDIQAEPVARVLNATLQAIAASNGDQQEIRPDLTVSNLTIKRDYVEIDTSGKTYMKDWKPNELEVFLL